MIISVALILLCGYLMSALCKKIRLPGLVGMIITGILLGPHCLSLLNGEIYTLSPFLDKWHLL